MIKFADVYLWGEHAGTIAWDESRQASTSVRLNTYII